MFSLLRGLTKTVCLSEGYYDQRLARRGKPNLPDWQPQRFTNTVEQFNNLTFDPQDAYYYVSPNIGDRNIT